MKSTLLKLAVVSFVGMMGIVGCDSGKSFEPKEVLKLNTKVTSYNSKIIDQSRYGATLEDGHFIDRYGISKITLPKGFRYLNGSASQVLCSSDEVLKVIDRQSAKTFVDINTSMPTVSASIHSNLVAYILSDNSLGIYDTKKHDILIQTQVGDSVAINTKAASPIFVDNLAVMPMLDGKLVIVDISDLENTNVVYISSDAVFNNVIYLSRIKDTLVAATPTKVVTLGDVGENEYATLISDVALNKSNIYLFAKDGNIIKLDTHLHTITSKKFDYARYSAVSAFGDKVVALDKNGALIVLNSTLSKYRIYDIDDVDNPVYINGNKLYKDGQIIDLSLISYE